MRAILPKIYSDETLYSIIARYHVMSGNPALKDNKKKTSNKRGKNQINIKEFNDKNIVGVLEGVSNKDDSNTSENL